MLSMGLVLEKHVVDCYCKLTEYGSVALLKLDWQNGASNQVQYELCEVG